jgi:pimeloyl-ACP methyl ester carboxylesterase
LPGGGGTVESFLPRTQPFTGEFRVVISDVRGIGRSDAPDIPCTMEMQADDLAGLLDTIGIDAAHVYSESFGGALAQYFAIRHPQKLKSLILVSTTCWARQVSEEAKRTTAAKVEMTEELARTIVNLALSREFIDKNPVIARRMTEGLMKRPPPTPGYIRSQEAFYATNTYELLPEIKVPTLVIHGDDDGVIPVGNAHILASRIPHAELKIFKNVGHFFIEAPGERDRAVLDFLRRHRNAGKGVI